MATQCNCNSGTVGDAEVREIYYKDDLDFYMTLRDCEGEDIGIPDYDWRVKLWTSSRLNYVVVSSVGGVLTNCRIDDGRIHVVVDEHYLTPGALHIDFEALLPDNAFADGTRRTVKPFTVPICLTRDAVPCPSSLEIEMMLPYIRGKALTFDDLTDAEKDAFAQNAADHVTIENLGVATDEEVDEAMGELLGTLPAVDKKPFHLDRRIRKGIMPAKARPGILYYNYGYVKIKPYRKGGVYQLEWDLSAFASYYDNPNRPMVLTAMRKSDIDEQYLADGNLVETAYEYDRATHILKFKIPEEKIGRGNFILPVTDADVGMGADNAGAFGHTENLMYIGEDGKLSFLSRSGVTDATVYEAPPLSTGEIKAFVNYLCLSHDHDKIWEAGLMNYKYWRKKRQGRPKSSKKPNKRKWCLQADTRSVARKYKENPPKIGVIKLMRVSGSGYRSRPVILSICRITGNEKCQYSILN